MSTSYRLNKFLKYSSSTITTLVLGFFSITGAMANFNEGEGIQKITDRVFVIHGSLDLPNAENKGFMNNPVIALGDNGVVVIDPGSSSDIGRYIIEQVKKLSSKPITHVLSTHIHGDHWLGNHAIFEEYPQAQFFAHPDMISAANAGEADSWIALLNSLTSGATAGTSAHIPDNALHDGQNLAIPGLPIRVHLSDHAHTTTDAMFELIDESVVILGDNGLNGRIGRMDDGHFLGNITALKKVIDINAKWYVPGHGKTGTIEVATKYHNYLKMIHDAAKHYGEDFMPAFEIKQTIEEDFKAYASWHSFDEQFGRHVSLASLEVEQDAF